MLICSLLFLPQGGQWGSPGKQFDFDPRSPPVFKELRDSIFFLLVLHQIHHGSSLYSSIDHPLPLPSQPSPPSISPSLPSRSPIRPHDQSSSLVSMNLSFSFPLSRYRSLLASISPRSNHHSFLSILIARLS
ncbi:hypothetical protein PGT21_050246 [Puccinia graminis f. sp. tritici]|uniref:Uncharacterized protein n=1 Tax=Puccinia graminis f. sp. tritici TaxID=56615 RepID=A0A5B0NTW6_PUCGR|nr:hypothetical protein PGT21_050246 [Puccinia graminis f. sp. tritici]